MSSNRPNLVINGRLTQGFTGAHPWEPAGYLRTDLSVLRGKLGWFPKSVKRTHLHKAIDYGTEVGTPVYAVHDGVITDQGRHPYTGEWYLILRIKVGPVYQLAFFYTHLLHHSFTRKIGDKVKRGDKIAKTGNSGWSTAPHIHTELGRGLRWETANFSNFYRWLKFDPHPFIQGRKQIADIA